MGLTYVLMTHEIDIARHASDLVVIMYLGRIAEDAGIADASVAPLLPYPHQLLLGASPRRRSATA